MASEDVKLTPELERLYLALTLRMAEGYTPSTRELAEALNIGTGTVTTRMRKLIDLGLVERIPGRHRALRLLKGNLSA